LLLTKQIWRSIPKVLMWKFRKTRWIVIATLAVVALLLWFGRGALLGRLVERQFHQPVPAAVSPLEVTRQQTVAATSGAEVNLAVPFSPQAPFADWEQPYQDACEEAALLMVERSLRGVSLTAAEADAEILRMVDFQRERFGFYKDSNIAETVRLAEAYFPQLSASAVYDITADDIRAQLVAGRPVVVLVDGRRLGNPFYTAPGPDKHALVVKGFLDDSFITNDPGTRRGADFVYAVDTMMAALVDYDGGAPGTGARAMIVIWPTVE
jgi:hypothetical protein